MWDKVGKTFGAIFTALLLYSYFTQDWVEYKCNLQDRSGNSLAEEMIYLYKKGGVQHDWGYKDDSDYESFGHKHKVIEGKTFISYLREGIYSYKLNKDDLTIHYRLGDLKGQCKKVGFFESIEFNSYETKEFTLEAL